MNSQQNGQLAQDDLPSPGDNHNVGNNSSPAVDDVDGIPVDRVLSDEPDAGAISAPRGRWDNRRDNTSLLQCERHTGRGSTIIELLPPANVASPGSAGTGGDNEWPSTGEIEWSASSRRVRPGTPRPEPEPETSFPSGIPRVPRPRINKTDAGRKR